MHAPLTHVPPPHVAPHAPQLAASVDGLTHELPHWMSGNGQTHAPELQTEPPLQTLPQEPQLLLSHFVSMQLFPQRA